MLKNEELIKIVYNKEQHNQTFLKGIPSSPGMIFGKALVLQKESISIPSEHIPIDKIPNEINRLETAVNDLAQELVVVLSKVKDDSKNISAVLESNLMILTDANFLQTVKNRINKGYSVENAVIQEFDNQTHLLMNSRDQILKERAIELEHIKERLLLVLRNRFIYYGNGKNAIVVAQSLTPSDIINFKEAGAIGFITEVGGITSHSSILARSYEIPEVIGVLEATKLIFDDLKLILDGYTGSIIINPDKESISNYISKKQHEEEQHKHLGDYAKLESVTKDGKKIKLLANIDTPDDIKQAVLFGAEGVGLVRSEHLIISKNHIPDEEEQYLWYKTIADRSYPNPVAIRAFDIGSDKYSEGMPKHEDNPALGFRGIRFLLQRKDIFKSQIRAILRVSKNKNVKLMLPMITCFYEVKQSVEIIENCKNELLNEGLAFDKSMPVGVMIETPAAALISEKIAESVDFLSIGSNDLTQYTLAVDRTNEFVSSIYDTFHPSVLSLIKLTADAANKYNKPVSICGEVAGHAAATILLIGMGITELSVSPPILLELKKRVREISYGESLKFINEIQELGNCEDIREKLSISITNKI